MSNFGAGTRLMGPLLNRSVANWTMKSLLASPIQQFTIVFGAGTSATATLSPAVVVANTILIYDGQSPDYAGSADAGGENAQLTLTNSTTITATRNGSDVGAEISVTAIEFVPGVLKSCQYGHGTGNVALSPFVTASKSIVLYLGHKITNTNPYVGVTVTLDGDGEGVTTTFGAPISDVAFCVAEFY